MKSPPMTGEHAMRDQAAVRPTCAQHAGRSAAGPGRQAEAQQPFDWPRMAGLHARKAEAVGRIEAWHCAAILNYFNS
jgi:hypothetical protein